LSRRCTAGARLVDLLALIAAERKAKLLRLFGECV
jgi:hypothetical protein